LGGALDGDVNICLQRARLIDGRQQRGGDYAIANANRDVADNAFPQCDDLEIVELNLLLFDLRIQRLQLCFRGIERSLRLIEILFADHSSFVQAVRAFERLLRQCDIGLLCLTHLLLAADGGLLFSRIDLHQGSARCNMITRVDINLRDLTFDFGHDNSRVAGFQGRNIFRGFVDGRGLCDLNFDGNPRRSASSAGSRLALSAAAAGCAHKQ